MIATLSFLKIARISAFLLLTILFCGCSVFMAMKGKPDANLTMLDIGQERSIVIVKPGPAS
ncbi:MAG: hypothetical protein M2R45_02010 [Verrucomicrobia subdivision 3 bacterium]|nr:hypothetical protein [Limisphaerales bacterium]MCS1414828.1 hypothetical protein [Limisphaerales bacterium]